jgi:hypothetical protein
VQDYPTGTSPLSQSRVTRERAKKQAPGGKKMNSTEQISYTVDTWVDEEFLPVAPTLKVIRQNDPWSGMDEEEVEDRKEFIRCHINKDLELLFMIPTQPKENDFWFSSYQEFIESPFNTHDFQRSQRPFNKYAYRIRKIMEQVKDLALLHSSISQPEGRANILRRYENLVENEFREGLLSLVDRYKRTFDEERRFELRRKIARLSRHILECKKIWEKYSPWENSNSHPVQIDSVEDGQTSSLG